MNKQLFKDVIGEVPPATVDVEAVITRGRRAGRIRRVANPTVAAGVAVVLVTGVVAFTMSQGDGGATGVGGQPTTSTEAPTTSSSRSANPPATSPPDGCSRPDLESSAEVVTRLNPVAKAAVQAQRPDLVVVPNTTGGTKPHGALEFAHYFLDEPEAADPPICHKHAGFEAKATTEGPEGRGNISIVVQAFYFNPSGFCEEVKETYCEEVAGPNGEIIVKYTSQEQNGVTIQQVYVLRPDGTLVWLSAENVATSAETDDTPTATTTPLDHDQLVAIGTDPAMTLFP